MEDGLKRVAAAVESGRVRVGSCKSFPRTIEACARVLGLGARFVVMGTAAIKTPAVVK
jgi:hypothetical protein